MGGGEPHSSPTNSLQGHLRRPCPFDPARSISAKEPSNAGAGIRQGLCVVRQKLARGSASLRSGKHRGTNQGWKQSFIESGLQTQAFLKTKNKLPAGHSPSSLRLSKMQKAVPQRPQES